MPMITRKAILSSLLLILAVHLAIADGVPPKVTGVSVSKAVKEGKPALNVTWTALQNVTNLTEYRVEYRLNGESKWDNRVSAQPYSTSTLLPALLPGTEYNVRMRAVSAAGEGEWSEVHTETTFSTPLRVTGVSLSKEVHMRKPSLNVTWSTLPLSLVSVYELQHRIKDTSWELQVDIQPNSQSYFQPYSQSYVLPNLVPGTAYNVRMRAVYGAENGEWSEVHTETTFDIPSRVTNVSVTMSLEDGNLNLTVSWTTPQSELPITEYEVEYEDVSEVMNITLSGSPPANATILSELDAGVEYIVIKVRALSEIGAGAWSEEQMVTPADILPKVTSVSVSKAVKQGEPTLRVTWIALQNDENLLEYHFEYRRNEGFNWNYTVNLQPYSTSTLLPALLPGTEYYVRMRAVSTAGEGEWSEVHTETTFSRPKVTNLSVTRSVEDGNLTLTVSWTTPQNELPIAEYEVEYRTSDTKSWINSTRLSVSPPAKSTFLTGLDAGVEYVIRVRALSEIGAGAWSEEQRVTADDTKDGSCNSFGNCRQPNETTTTPVPAAPPLGAIVGAIVAVGVVLLVLLILGAVPLVVCLMRRQKRTKGEIIDDDACAQDTDDNAVPTSLDYYDTQEGFEMTTQRTSTDSLPEAQRSDSEYDYTSTTVPQFPALESHYDLEEGLYWEPATSLHGIKAQINQKAKDSIELDPAAITLQESLGEGEFGIVYKGVWASSPQGPLQVAVKSLHSQEKDNKYKLLKEAAIMGQFSHPNVVRLYGVIDKPGKVMLIMEYLSEGDLHNHLMNYRSPTAHKTLSLTLLRFCQEIAGAMDYLSKKGFIHRDLAARNILLSEQYIAKIADFGMSHDLDEDHYYKSKGGMIPVKWTAPESVLYKKYTTKSDVWSYGMVMYEIWSLGCKPFEEFDINSVLRAFETGYCQPPPPGCPRNIYKLMVDCWNPEHQTRPTFEDITRELATDSEALLSWSQEDKETSSKAAVLGAPLEEGTHLYQELQNKYM